MRRFGSVFFEANAWAAKASRCALPDSDSLGLWGAASRGWLAAMAPHSLARLIEAGWAEEISRAWLRRACQGNIDCDRLGVVLSKKAQSAHGPEARFIYSAASSAFGAMECAGLSTEAVAWMSPSLRRYRRRLRRFDSALKSGSPLGVGTDALAEAGAYLDRLRQEGAGAAWPHPKMVALREARVLERSAHASACEARSSSRL